MLPRTRKQQEEHKRRGKITGYFSLPRGRPPKETVTDVPALPSQAARGGNLGAGTSTVAAEAPTKHAEKRGRYLKWTSPSKQKFLARAVGATTQRSISGVIGK
jgi:hypothetical protein